MTFFYMHNYQLQYTNSHTQSCCLVPVVPWRYCEEVSFNAVTCVASNFMARKHFESGTEAQGPLNGLKGPMNNCNEIVKRNLI